MLNMRMMSAVFAAVAFLLAGTISFGPDGPSLVSEALAADGVKVSVTVAKGTKGGTGVDGSLSKHSGTLELVAGYGGWKPAGSANLALNVGGKASETFGSHSFTVVAQSVSGGKAKTVITVKDSNGSPNTLRSSLANGGSTVVMMRSADGKTAHAYIVRVRF